MALVLTKKGLELLQKLQVGEIPAIEFSDVAVGDGLWASSDINLDIAALKSVRIKTGIGSKKTTTRGEDTIVTISATLNNENITKSFYVREVGLYAKDGESEILYAYDIIPENETAQAVVQSNIVPQYIPIMLDTALSNIDAVNITVTDDINFVITSEFEEYKENTAETINNLKSELQGKIDEANELIASLNTAIDTAKSEITTAYQQADTALQIAINGKAATNHNHDSTYSKTNHTHSNYAASSHNHAFSAITGSMDITDSRLTGNLPVARVTGAATVPTYYITSVGYWFETTLSDGGTMLEGYNLNSRIGSDGLLMIDIPKSVGGISLLATYFGGIQIEAPPLVIGVIGMTVFVIGKPNEIVSWSMKGYFKN